MPETPETPGTPSLAPLALVTGASSGIGRALARQLVERGHDVVVVAEDDGVYDAATELRAAGGQVTTVQADLTDPAQVEELHRTATADGRTVAVLALNAGVGVGGRFDQTPLRDHLRLVDLNVRSTVHLAHLLLPAMVERGEGRVLVTASIAAKAPGPWHATYAASKAFVHSFAEGIRQELSGTGVTVTSLMPGPTDTSFFDRAGMEDTGVAQGPKDDPEDVARQGLDALFKGKDHVVAASLRSKAMAAASSAAPDAVAASLMGGQTRPGSGS